MRLTDLIEPDLEALLYHPDIGPVLWAYNSDQGGYVLMFDSYSLRGTPMVVDVDVLFDDKWRLRDEGEEE